jgi:hypothetical protein
MKRVLSLVVALGVAALFSSAALAGADCSAHKTTAAVEKTDASKDVATAPVPDKPAADQVHGSGQTRCSKEVIAVFVYTPRCPSGGALLCGMLVTPCPPLPLSIRPEVAPL